MVIHVKLLKKDIIKITPEEIIENMAYIDNNLLINGDKENNNNKIYIIYVIILFILLLLIIYIKKFILNK